MGGGKIPAIGHGGFDCTDNLRCWAVAPPGARLDSISTTQTESQVQKLVTAMLIIAGIIHLLPLPGVLGPERLASLYGLNFEEANIAILMRHRAVLFGLLGLFLVYAAFRPALQPLAFIAGFVSVVSFLALAYSTGGYNAGVPAWSLADWVALACLVVGAAAAVASSGGR